MTKQVFVAVPGTTGELRVLELDTTKRIQDMYYKGPNGMTPCGYCYRLDSQDIVTKAFNEMQKEESDLKDRHYKKLMELRKLYGV